MQTQQVLIRDLRLPVAGELAGLAAVAPQLLLLFGSVEQLTQPGLLPLLQHAFPDATLAGCSTAGEIHGTTVVANTLSVTAVHFDQVRVAAAAARIESMEQSAACGATLGKVLAAPDLRAVLVFGRGVAINGSALVDGLAGEVAPGVAISGGLAGDNGAFVRTLTLSSQQIADDQVVAVGLYGDALICTHGSFGGWQAFGPLRKVTRCQDNVLYSLDDEPALAVYKRYLGDYAAGLPGSGLLFPFEMVTDGQQGRGLIRTILGVDEASGSVTLAGAIDPDGYLRLMHAHTDALVDGAEAAARHALPSLASPALALLVSCVGRKLVMGDRVDEEVEAVADVFGAHCALTGFYSYGEISPDAVGVCQNADKPRLPVSSQLHNQTMTVTCFAEKDE